MTRPEARISRWSFVTRCRDVWSRQVELASSLVGLACEQHRRLRRGFLPRGLFHTPLYPATVRAIGASREQVSNKPKRIEPQVSARSGQPRSAAFGYR